MKCGHELKRDESGNQSMCPAASEYRLNGCNGGLNGGRACWVVPGTVCGNKVQGIFATKLVDCLECEFYHLVHEEEREKFIFSDALMRKLKTDLNSPDYHSTVYPN
jgi:hypothetical protein